MASVLLWQMRLPQAFSLPIWRPQTIFFHTPEWLADNLNWPYALSLSGLAFTVIATSMIRTTRSPLAWAGTLILTAIGVLAVTTDNPLTLVLVWSALDLTELVLMLRSVEGERVKGVVFAFAARVAGIGLALWASVSQIAAGIPLSFRSLPAQPGLYLLIAAGLRLGVLPLHLPYQESALRRGFGTTLRLVTAASSLALLGLIPTSAAEFRLAPLLLIFTALAGLYAGWMWLRASDELAGRPYWLIGMAALTVGATLRGNPTGSVAWGNGLILGGGLLFLFSARQAIFMWLPLAGIWGLSSLPFSLTASGWSSGIAVWPVFWPFLLTIQVLLLAGYIRHSLHPGETSLESQSGWARVIYPIGFINLILISILLGLWGWNGAQIVGPWWVGIIAISLAGGTTWLSLKILTRLTPLQIIPGRWIEFLRLKWLYRALQGLYGLLDRTSATITSLLEGDGGVIWSLLLLVLLISILAQAVQ